MARTLAQWNALKPAYRSRLERGGISSSDYVAGVRLSEARGQTRERERSETLRETVGGAASTVRAWRRRAIVAGVKPGDVDDAIESEGLDTVRDGVIAKERLHLAYVAAGSPGGNVRRVLRREHLYAVDRYPGDIGTLQFLSANYGESWGYYH